MNRWFASCLLLMWLTAWSANGTEVRTWTDSTGRFRREAEFVRLEGDAVVLKTDGGNEIRVPLNRLQQADQQYAKTAAALVPTTDDPFTETEHQTGPINPIAANPSSVNSDVRLVVAQGVGTSIEDAKKDAFREAVRQVVGAYIEGETLIRNDELIEDKVLALSGALIQKADVIPESISTKDGLVRLRIRAEVKVTEVMKSLAKINVTTNAVRSSDLQGQMVTLADQTQAAELALSDAKSWAEVPASFFRMSMVGQPKVLKAKEDNATVQLLLQLSPDRDQYMAFANRLIAVLSKLEGPKGDFVVDGRNPEVSARGMQEAKDELWRHILLRSFMRGNGADPEISYAFPPNDRERLYGYFEDMRDELPQKSQCLVYCFDQDASGQPHGCGLKRVAEEWKAAIGRSKDERIVVCVMAHANESFSRTKWEWFTCDRSLFSEGTESPWLRCIECEVTMLTSAGDEVTSDVIPLSEGFGISPNLRYNTPSVMVAPAWVEKGDGWPECRHAYVPQFTFPRWFELSADEASSIREVRCTVRPLIRKPE
jgi:hypothetical protein